MNLETYYHEALRTLVPRGLAFDLNHSVIGLVTEIGEAATLVKRNEIYGKPWDDEMRAHLAEELGDICWYIPCGLQALGGDHSETIGWLRRADAPPFGQFDAIKMMASGAGRLCQESDKLPYADGLQRVMDCYERVLTGVISLCQIHSLDFAAVLDQNIEKLRKRYPEKFTAELAEARLDKNGVSARES